MSARSLTVLLLLGGCAPPDSQPAQGERCFACHGEHELFAPGPGDGLAPREWLAEQGQGLVALPARSGMVLEWPERGRHGESDRGRCLECHPVEGSGAGHGAARYPSPAADDAACERCHGWIPSRAVSEGFLAAALPRPRYEGSLRPLPLLSSGADAHARIFREGFTARAGDGARLLVTRIEPGCVGCHSLSSEAHGEVPSCTDCHRFGSAHEPGTSAAAHLALIDALRGANDPNHLDQPSCVYCHGSSPTPDNVHRPACYNCHLSGHRPVAVLWPAGN